MEPGVRVTVLDIDADHTLDDGIAEAQRFTAARQAVREVLGAEIGREPEDVQIEHGRNGKPIVPDGPHFSMSRCGRFCVVVTCDAHPVGVDVERVPDRLPTALLNMMPAQAQRAVLAAEEPDRPRQFAFWWCRMTAAVKACGAGLDEAAACLAAAPQRIGLLLSDLAAAAAAIDAQPPEVEWAEMFAEGKGRRRGA
jgi:phosphopantetheinyl transferase